MDLHQTIQDSMGGFEKLVSKIPGYAGYKEKEQRRAADTLLREHIVRQYQAQWQRMNDIKSQMLVGPAMSQLDDMGKASRKLQTLIDKVESAAQGYAGFFSPVKVKEEQLDDLYRFDEELLDKTDDIAIAVDQVQSALDNEENVAPSVRALTRLIDDLLRLFEKRKEVVLGLA